MRFAHMPPSKPEPRTPAADFLRRLLANDPARAEEAPLQPASQDAPLDLDQRVRLVGEW